MYSNKCFVSLNHFGPITFFLCMTMIFSYCLWICVLDFPLALTLIFCVTTLIRFPFWYWYCSCLLCTTFCDLFIGTCVHRSSPPVWFTGCFSTSILQRYYVIKWNMDRGMYQNILEDFFISLTKKLNLGRRWTFKQDGDTKDTDKINQDWF